MPSDSASRTFDGLTSRWTMPFRWACASASRICAAASTESRSASSPAAMRLAQRAAGDVLVGDVDVARIAGERVDPLAARMAQRGRGARLPLGPFGDATLAHDHLQRDVEAVALVAREPDVAHATGAERPKRPVPSQDQLVRERRQRSPPVLLRAEENSFRRRTTLGRFDQAWIRPTTTSSSTSSRRSRPRPRRPRSRVGARLSGRRGPRTAGGAPAPPASERPDRCGCSRSSASGSSWCSCSRS